MLKYIHLWLEETVVARWLVNDREVGENFAQANKKGFMVQDQLVSWGNSKQNICHCLVFFFWKCSGYTSTVFLEITMVPMTITENLQPRLAGRGEKLGYTGN